MSQESRTTLKGYFNTGDKPTESQYANLIDSCINITDDSTSYFALNFARTSYSSKSANFTHSINADTTILFILIRRTLSNPTVKCGSSPGADDIFKQRTIDPDGEYYTITLFKSFKNSGTLYFTVSGGTVNLNVFHINSIM